MFAILNSNKQKMESASRSFSLKVDVDSFLKYSHNGQNCTGIADLGYPLFTRSRAVGDISCRSH